MCRPGTSKTEDAMETKYLALKNADPDNHLHLFQVFMSAENNAYHTVGCLTEDNREDFYATAYGSISCTSHFDEHADVRQWFADHGYEY